MKKFKKILMIAIPLLLLNLRTYAIDQIVVKGNEYAKYGAIIIAVLILVLIIYATYKADKKSELKEELAKKKEKPSFEVVVPEEDEVDIFANEPSDYTHKNIMEEVEEDNVYNTVNEYIENEEESEEESLYNNVNDYIDSKEELYNKAEQSINEYKGDDIRIDENEGQENIDILPTEDVVIEETVDSIYTNTEEDYSTLESEEESYSNSETNLEEEIDEFTFDTAPIINNKQENKEELSSEENIVEEEKTEEEQPTKSVKKYTGKKLNRIETNIMDDIEIENEDFDEEDDEDIGVPTFDDLLKKSEEEEPSEIEPFDFMAQMEENLKKDQEKRLEKKQTTKKEGTKKETTKKQATKKKSTKKKNEE